MESNIRFPIMLYPCKNLAVLFAISGKIPDSSIIAWIVNPSQPLWEICSREIVPLLRRYGHIGVDQNNIASLQVLVQKIVALHQRRINTLIIFCDRNRSIHYDQKHKQDGGNC